MSEVKDKTLEAVLVENEQLKAEVAALKKLVGQLQGNLAAAGITDDIRDEVRERMAGGLSQPDAVEVVRRQRAHDLQLQEDNVKAITRQVESEKKEAALKAAAALPLKR